MEASKEAEKKNEKWKKVFWVVTIILLAISIYWNGEKNRYVWGEDNLILDTKTGKVYNVYFEPIEK